MEEEEEEEVPPAPAPRAPAPARVPDTPQSARAALRLNVRRATPVRPMVDRQYAVAHAHEADLDATVDSELDELAEADQSVQSAWERGAHSNRRAGPPRVDSVTSLSNLMREPRLRRTSSTHSNIDGMSGRMPSRHASSREMLDEVLGRSDRHRVGGGGAPPEGSAAVAAQIASIMAQRRITERYAKPIVSTFATYQQQFDPHASVASSTSSRAWGAQADEVPGRIMAADVPESSVFAPGFVERVEARMAGAAPEPAGDDAPQYRYLLDYALSGPPVNKAALAQVELMPQAENSLPLPTNSSAHVQQAVPDSSATLGPNMIPFHFIHALTSSMENALALDHAEVPAMASLLPGVGAAGMCASPTALDSGAIESEDEAEHVHYIDNRSMRAVACTAQAVAVQRAHTVTRRFADPLRESLERVARESGYTATLAAAEPARSRMSPSTSLFGLSQQLERRGHASSWAPAIRRNASMTALAPPARRRAAV